MSSLPAGLPPGPFGEIVSIPVPDDIPGTGQLINIQSSLIQNDSGIELDVDSINRCPPGWQELKDYSENWEIDNNEAVRTFEGPWSRRKQFVDWLLGIALTNPQSPSGTGLMRFIPAQHPEYPWLYATSVRELRGQGLEVQNPQVFDPLGRNLNMIAFIDYSTARDSLSCRLQVRYQALNYEVRSDAEMAANRLATELHRYVERSEEYALKSLPIPSNSTLAFTSGANPGQPIPASAANIYVPLQELTYTWQRVPDPPTDAFAACQGRVNLKAFDPQVRINGRRVGMVPNGYAPETLLCQAPHKARHRGPTGRVEWTIVYKFLYNASGWNTFPDSKGDFSPAAFPDGSKLYKPVDFGQLFVPPSELFNYQ